MSTFDTPVLFLVFNRPDHTAKVFERIREVKPKYLFVAADGPRTTHGEEAEKCDAVRKLITDGVDWECNVRTLFREENLGCGRAVSSAISWFFGEVEEGIILEDDCLPNRSFFFFCQSLLNRFRSRTEVMHIGGGCYIPSSRIKVHASYYASKYPYIWGWATWKRAWNHFDAEMKGLNLFIENRLADKCASNEEEFNYWRNTFVHAKANNDIWDFKWNYSVWNNDGICLHPTNNYIRNIGFGDNATRTKSINKIYRLIPQVESPFEMIHSKDLEINRDLDSFVFRRYNLGKDQSSLQKMLSKFSNFFR